MRIDLPQCGLDTCRYSFDCNCTDVKRYKTCEFAYFKELEADGRLIELPCKVGDTVWAADDKPVIPLVVSHIGVYLDGADGGDWESLSNFGNIVFLTKEDAEARLAELKGDK